MHVDGILDTLNRHRVEYLLVGGVNFLLRHQPVMTFDVDIWIHDTEDNRSRCEAALRELAAEWGPTEKDWGPVSELAPGWLSRQRLFCLTTPLGALDVFRTLAGVPSWEAAAGESFAGATAQGVPYRGLCDRDMLRSQEVLPKSDQKADRIAYLQRILAEGDRP